MADPTVQAWQRATPRDLLTGEPLRDETPKMRVKVLNPPTGQRNEPVRYGVYRRPASQRVITELEPLAYIAADAAEGDADAE